MTALGVCAVAVALSSCKAEATLDLDIQADGSGTLALTTDFDDEARRLAGTVPAVIRQPFADLAELAFWFEQGLEASGADLVTLSRADARGEGSRELTIDLGELVRQISGERGSAVLAAVTTSVRGTEDGAALLEQSADIRLRIRHRGHVVAHNAERSRNGWLEWRLWPAREATARVTIEADENRLAGPTRRLMLPGTALAGAAVALVLGTRVLGARVLGARGRRRRVRTRE